MVALVLTYRLQRQRADGVAGGGGVTTTKNALSDVPKQERFLSRTKANGNVKASGNGFGGVQWDINRIPSDNSVQTVTL